MVKKIGIGLLCALIVLTSFLTTIPKTYALSDETEYYGRTELQNIMNGSKFIMEYELEAYELLPIDQEYPYYINCTIDLVEILMTCNYQFIDNKLIMNVYVLDIYLEYMISYNYGIDGNENDTISESASERLVNYDENGNPIALYSIVINENYNIEAPWLTFERDNKLNDNISFSYNTDYNESNEETTYSIYFEYSLFSHADSFYHEFNIVENELIVTPIKSLSMVYNSNFNNDISSLTPIYQYKYQRMHDNSFITDEMAYSNVMNTVFDSFAGISMIEIFPGISIAMILGIPFLLGLFLIIIKLIRS